MSRKTKRAAAFAAAATFLFTLANIDGSGAFANEGEVMPVEQDSATSEADGPRFVAFPVVQPLSADADVAGGGPAGEVAETLAELVAEMPGDGLLSRDMRCLAEAIYFEARGEPLEGQLAVGRVVINRAASGKFPGDYCGVVMQPAQFSFVKRGQMPIPQMTSSAWRRAVAMAQIAHRELWDSPADDALYFHATSVRPRWANQKVVQVTLARHIFYR